MSESVPGLPAPAIDGPWRADSYGSKIAPARNGNGLEELKLTDYSSFALYGKAEDGAQDLIQAIRRQAIRQQSSVILSEIDSRESMAIQSYATDLLKYAVSYLKLLREARILRSSNAKYLLALIPLTVESLSEPRLISTLDELIRYSKLTVLRPVLLLQDPELIPEELQQGLSWQAFLGRDQITYLRDRYTVTPLPGMSTREPLGVALDGLTGTARVLNSLSYTPTANALELKRALADDRANYERFLEGLTDGR